MYSLDGILKAREERQRQILSLAAEGPVVTVKANIPGRDKRVGESYLIVRYFTARIALDFGGEAVLYDGADGPYSVITQTTLGKAAAIELESSPVGRFADIDVYPKGARNSLSRGYMRKCFICDNPAFLCSRTSAHGAAELLGKIRRDTREYFSELITRILKDSMIAELKLENKFGLVTPTSSGSHGDLNYSVMSASQDAVIPYLVGMFWTGFDCDCKDILAKTRRLGIEAEEAMYAVSGGANAYKGLIFVLGVMLASAGNLLASGRWDKDGAIATVRTACRGICAELVQGEDTFGKRAYKLYKISGVRGNAESGFPVAWEAAELIDENYSSDSLMSALIYIVGKIDDTVLLKRSGSLQKYEYFKDRISSVNPYDKHDLEILNGECIDNNISIGGSADMLVAGVLIKKFLGLWYFDK